MPSMPEQIDFLQILQTLVNHQVDFILVGGLCGALHGAPINTLDVDVVHDRQEENAQRLLNALGEMDSRYREHTTKKLTPKLAHLLGPGHHLLWTRFGPLDVLGTIVGERGYEELLPHSEWTDLDDIRFQTLTLKSLIDIKVETGRQKDLLAVPILKHTLAEQQNRPTSDKTEP